MSNYPAGVTGNEPEINGPISERDEHRACEAGPQTIYVADYHVLLDLHDAERRLRSGPSDCAAALALVQNAIRNIEAVHDFECTWSGDVTVSRYDGWEEWTCPVCQHCYEGYEGSPEDAYP